METNSTKRNVCAECNTQLQGYPTRDGSIRMVCKCNFGDYSK